MSDGVIARGRIKVDARKALDKLRDHMLVDPHLWACEIARVAIALGATFFAVDWSSDELTFDFDGRALAPDQIAHARDHVLTPLEGPDGDALRALGIAIGAALSLDPAHIDVYSAGHCVRFERKYMQDAEAAPAPLPRADFPPGRMRVSFKKRFGLSFFTGASTPEEVTFLRQDFDAPTCRLEFRGVAPAPREQVVVTVDLDVPGTTRAHLEVLRRPVEPRIDFLHYGVRLASSTVRGIWGLATRPRALLPLRVVIDTTDLPTNASRSQVRSDAELIQRVFARIEPAFAVAMSALRGEPNENAAKIGHTVIAHSDAAVLTDVLGAIAAEAAIAVRAGHEIEPRAHRLLDEPVAFDALGRRIALRSLQGGVAAQPLRIYEGSSALPEELGPWMAGTLWKQGLSAERAIEGLALASVKDLIEPAMIAMQRRARALEHPPSRPVTSRNADWKEHFSVKSGPFAGLEGEIAMGGGTGVSNVRLYVDQRLLETVSMPGAKFLVEIALAWPGRIVASFAYDSVSRNEDLTRALHYALRVAAMGIGRHSTDPLLIRLATQAWADATRSLGDGVVSPVGLGALATIPAWRTTDGGLTTFAAIYGYARLTGAVCYASTNLAASDGRIVVQNVEVGVLRSLLPENTDFVAYDRALGANGDVSEPVPPVAVMIHKSGLDGFIAPSADKIGRLRVYHAGVCLRRETWPSRNGPVEVVLIDRGGVPRADMQAFRYASPLPNLDAEEDALVEAVTQACESDAIDYAAVEAYLDVSRALFHDRKENKPLEMRILALPERREKRRLERLKENVLARAPVDIDALSGGRIRGTVVAPKKGAVTVALAPWGPATVLYSGHPLGSETIGRLDVEAWVDVVDDDFVAEWAFLSEIGKTWAEDAIRDAAHDLVEKLSAIDGFADNELALRLTTSLVPESPMRLGMLVGRVAWPTAQGGTLTLGDAVAANCSVHSFSPWRLGAESPFDAPALHLPATKIGEARRKLFSAAGIQLTDVTDATTRLQALRAKGVTSAPPQLLGMPEHPQLRRSLSMLGATMIDGELELIEGPQGDVARIRGNGVRESMPIFNCPIRAVYRSETDDVQAAGQELIDATKKLLRSIIPSLAKQPPFAVRHVRNLVLAQVAQTGRMDDADRNITIFEATNGRFYRLSSFLGHASYTTDPPPYPPMDDIVLRLDRAEAAALSKVIELRDDTQAMRAKARGMAARNAPPLTEIRVKEREQCMFFIDVNEEGIVGEIGVLRPSHAGSRRIDVHTTMRPVTFMPDPEGWPVIAAFNDDSLQVDESFSALVDPKRDTTRFHQLIRRILGSSLGKLLTAPPSTLGIVRLPVPLLLRSVRGKRVAAAMGVFWLPTEWPERPSIHVEGIGIVDPDRVPLVEQGANVCSRVVPVCGKLWVTAEANDIARAVEDVMAWVSVRLVPHVRSHKGSEKYLWDLALLGVLEDEARNPAKQLQTDRPDPNLMHVASRRAPHLIDRSTGDAPTAPTYVQHARIATEESTTIEAIDTPAPAPPPDRPSQVAPEESFLAGLVRRVTDLVSGGPQVLVETPLTKALSQAIEGLALTGQPVQFVQASQRGRPLSYVRDAKKLIVNAKHPVVVAHAARENGMLFLVLAALSEINRELAEVTDAEEVSKILDLLRANQA